MKDIYKAVGICASIVIGCALIKDIKKSKKNIEENAKFYSRELVSRERTEEECAILKKGVELEKRRKVLANKETEEIFQKVHKELDSMDYDNRLAKTKESYKKAIDQLKKDISYNERKQAIEKNFEDTIEHFKEVTQMNLKKRELRAKKKEAEDIYSKQLATLRLTIGSGNSGYSSMRRAFMATRDEAVRKCDEKIKDIDDTFDTYRKNEYDKKVESLNHLEEELKERTDDITTTYNQAIKNFKKVKDDLYAKVEANVEGNRSPVEKILVWENSQIQDLVDKIQSNEVEKADDIYNKLTFIDKYGINLAANNVSVETVVLATSLPILTMIFATYKCCLMAIKLCNVVKEASKIYKKG